MFKRLRTILLPVAILAAVIGGVSANAATLPETRVGGYRHFDAAPRLATPTQVPESQQASGFSWYDTASECSVAAKSGVRFGQQGVSATFRHGEFAGRTIEDVAAGLRSGAIKAEQLPIQTITRDGVSYTVNNRSLMALRQAGLEPTVIKDVTGNAFFERQLTERLAEMGGQVAPDFVPVVRGAR
jgi:hypothetical protein